MTRLASWDKPGKGLYDMILSQFHLFHWHFRIGDTSPQLLIGNDVLKKISSS